MNIALIGYGRMGHEIETIALKRGHNIKLIVDQDNISDLNETNLKGIDVAIEFSFPEHGFFDDIVSFLPVFFHYCLDRKTKYCCII